MKKRIIYLLMAAIGTVGFTGCGPGHNTTQDRTGTYTSPTGTQMGTQTQDRAVNTNQTTTTTGTRTATTTGTTTGTTAGNTGQRAADANNNATGAGTTQATQISGNTTNASTQTQARNNFRLNQATDYSYNNENFRFTPDQRGINITRNQNGTQTPFGTMRSFGNDGYYMVTTTNAAGQEETSVGRFDERGNFTVYRYDRTGDRMTEQNYRTTTPMNQNNR